MDKKIKAPKLNVNKKPKDPNAPKWTDKVLAFIKDPKTLNTASVIVVGLMHILFIVAVILAFRYFAIYPSLVLSLLGILVCVITAIDIVYIVGFRQKDKIMKIISVVMAFLIFIASTVGTYYLGKVNSAVSNVIGTTVSNEANYEEVNGVFVCRSEKADKYTDLSSISGKTVGYVTESERGVAEIGLELLDSNNISYGYHAYTSYEELLVGLYDKDVDVAIFLDGYSDLYARNAEEGNADYTGIISEFTDFYPFTGEVEVTKSTSTKDITKDPFNVLLIGYSRTAIGSSIGLADAIIIASVNPQTYTVSMMSIARDSYVPISCYGGKEDKINSARGTSRACFIQTVQDYTGLTIDYYMEADYEAVVDVVDAIEGIEISNPVDFTLDGVYVPAGDYTAWGWQVLEFCRERHHMPNGDFDRQQHQKEVIIAIAEKLLKKGDITLFLNAIEAAGDKFSTNLTLNQLTTMFNMLLSTKNYTGLKISKLIDFNQLRLTGYADWHYDTSLSLPLWIYRVYQGSYDESIQHAEYVLGEIDDTANQTYSFTYDKNNPYDRPLFYSLSYDEEEYHETLPAYYPNFVGYSYADVLNMASENGYNLNFEFISSSSSAYDESQDGYVVAQSLRYGTLCSAGANTLTVMGDGSVTIKFPEYGDWSLNDAIEWCNEKGYDYSTVAKTTADATLSNRVADMSQSGKSVVITYYTYTKPTLTLSTSSLTLGEGSTGTISATSSSDATITWSSSNSSVASVSGGTVTANKAGTVTITATADGLTAKCTVTVEHVWDSGDVTKDATCKETGTKKYTCTKCGETKTETIPLADHKWDAGTVTTAPTCSAEGLMTYKCTICGETTTKPIAKTAHTVKITTAAKNPTCTEDGTTEGSECSVCGTVISVAEKIPATGHKFTDNTVQYCENGCGAVNPNYVAPTTPSGEGGEN